MRWRLRPGLLAQTALPEAIVLDTDRGEYFELNAVASLMLVAVTEGVDDAEAVARIVARFAIDEAHARRDYATLVADLVARGWLIPAA